VERRYVAAIEVETPSVGEVRRRTHYPRLRAVYTAPRPVVGYRVSSVDRSSLVCRHTCRCCSSRARHIVDHIDAGRTLHRSTQPHRHNADARTSRAHTP